jgi:hypothetical protein
VGPLGIQLPRRLTEKVSQESITSEPNNSSQNSHGGADYHGNGNKGREECHDTGSLNGKPRWPAHGHRGFLVQRNHESGGIVIVYSLPERCDSCNSVISTFNAVLRCMSPHMALFGPPKMSDLSRQWGKADLDQVAVTNRNFMSTRH